MSRCQAQPNLTVWVQRCIEIIFKRWKWNGERGSVSFAFSSSFFSGHFTICFIVKLAPEFLRVCITISQVDQTVKLRMTNTTWLAILKCDFIGDSCFAALWRVIIIDLSSHHNLSSQKLGWPFTKTGLPPAVKLVMQILIKDFQNTSKNRWTVVISKIIQFLRRRCWLIEVRKRRWLDRTGLRSDIFHHR